MNHPQSNYLLTEGMRGGVPENFKNWVTSTSVANVVVSSIL